MGLAIRAPVVMVFLLIVLVVILAIFFAPESLYTKAKNAVDNIVDKGLADIKGGKIRQEEDTTPKEIKDLFYALKETFEKTGKECITKHPDFSELGNYEIIVSNVGEDVYFTLMDGENPIDVKSVNKKNVCIVAGKNKDGVAAENFFKYYIEKNQQYKDKLKYINPTSITIEDKEKIKIDGKGFGLEDGNLMFVDGENICFFPTYLTGTKWYNPITIISKWGCDVSEGGMDNDCIKDVSQKIKGCDGGIKLKCEEMSKDECFKNKDKCYPTFKTDDGIFDKCNDCESDFKCSNIQCEGNTDCESICNNKLCGKECFFRPYSFLHNKGCNDASKLNDAEKILTFDECVINHIPLIEESDFIGCQICFDDYACSSINLGSPFQIEDDSMRQQVCEADICNTDCYYSNLKCYQKTASFTYTCTDGKEECKNKIKEGQKTIDWDSKGVVVDISITINGETWYYWGTSSGVEDNYDGFNYWIKEDVCNSKDVIFEKPASAFHCEGDSKTIKDYKKDGSITVKSTTELIKLVG